MVKRLVGYATTDSNGVAVLEYVGKGVGEMDIVAEVGGEVYFTDAGTSDNSSNWSLGGVTYTQSNGAVTLANASGGTRWVKPRVNNADISFYANTDYCLELDVKNVNATNISVILLGKSFDVTSYVSTSNWSKVKLYSLNNKVYLEVNGTAISSADRNASTEDVSLRIANGESYSFRNFFVYSGVSSLVSEPKTIWDTLEYDNAKNNDYNENVSISEGLNLNRDGDGTAIDWSNNTSNLYLTTPSSTFHSAPYCIEFDLISSTASILQARLGGRDSNNNSTIPIITIANSTLSDKHITLKIYTDKAIVQIDNENPVETTLQDYQQGYFRFYIRNTNTGGSIKYANLRKYKL